MGFTKLDEGIIKSSIMAEDPATFKIWITLLASCKENGISDVSSVFLASICRLPEDVVDKAIGILEGPDTKSRSTEDEGRRIRKVDGGYYVVNYRKYRAFDYSPTSEAARKKAWRDKKKAEEAAGRPGHLGQCPKNVRDISASASESDSSSTDQEDKTKIIGRVVAYLNEKAGKKFNPRTKATAGHISARLEEGRTEQDCYQVIDIKVAKWKGKTWPDTRPGREGQMVNGDDYLRPGTLFLPENFENYLNEKPEPKKPLRAGERNPEWETYVNAKHKEEAKLADEFHSRIEAAKAAGDTKAENACYFEMNKRLEAWKAEYKKGRQT